MVRLQICLVAVALCATVASGFCVWKPRSMFVPSERNGFMFFEAGRDKPKLYDNFSAAADACLKGKSSSNCREILCAEEKCTAPIGRDFPGMRYVPSGNCHQPLVAGGYCDRRSWYEGHPCNDNERDYCCEGDCEHCGPRAFCIETFGTHAGVCNPRYGASRGESARPLCSKYFQDCNSGPNPGKELTPGIRFNKTEAVPAKKKPPPAPLSAVQLGGGVKTKSCERHGLNFVTSFALCELVAEAMGVSWVTECLDPKKCAKRPHGCILQRLASCPGCGKPKAMLNLLGQKEGCGVGNSEYDRFDCICLRQGSESVLGQRPAVDNQTAEKEVADKQLAAAKAKAKKAEAAAAAAAAHAEEGWKMAAQVRKQWKREEDQMYGQLEAEVKEWKELAERREERESRNASNAAALWAMRQDELRWVTHEWLAAILGLTGLVLLCATCMFGMVCCFTFRYARVHPEAREPKITSELQDAFVQADPTGEFSQMQA